MPKKVVISAEVRAVLERSQWDGNLVVLPPGMMPRPLYVETDKVLKALGGKWNRRKNAHVFPGPTADIMREALNAGHAVDQKRTIELFETPPPVALRMAQIAAGVSDLIGRQIRVLEPSAGRGRLLAAFAENLESNGCDEVIAIDIDFANCEALRQQGIATVVVGGDFLGMLPQVPPIKAIGTAAALIEQPGEQADVILMNPPFGRHADIAHVAHAFTRWLAPGGILVAIMSPHWTFGQSRAAQDFRESIYGPPAHEAQWEQLPENTFREEGTGVNAGLLILRKPA